MSHKLNHHPVCLAEASIRALSFTRSVVESLEEEVIWKRVSAQEFKAVIAEAIKGLDDLDQLPLVDEDSAPLPEELSVTEKPNLRTKVRDHAIETYWRFS